MGFASNHISIALASTGEEGTEAAMIWLLENQDQLPLVAREEGLASALASAPTTTTTCTTGEPCTIDAETAAAIAAVEASVHAEVASFQTALASPVEDHDADSASLALALRLQEEADAEAQARKSQHNSIDPSAALEKARRLAEEEAWEEETWEEGEEEWGEGACGGDVEGAWKESWKEWDVEGGGLNLPELNASERSEVEGLCDHARRHCAGLAEQARLTPTDQDQAAASSQPDPPPSSGTSGTALCVPAALVVPCRDLSCLVAWFATSLPFHPAARVWGDHAEPAEGAAEDEVAALLKHCCGEAGPGEEETVPVSGLIDYYREYAVRALRHAKWESAMEVRKRHASRLQKQTLRQNQQLKARGARAREQAGELTAGTPDWTPMHVRTSHKVCLSTQCNAHC